MHGKVVLVCTDRLRTWRLLIPSLAGAGNQVIHAQATGQAVDLLASGAVDLALVEWPSAVELDPILEAAEQRVQVVALVTGTGIRALEELVCRRGLFHLCAARPEQEVNAARMVDTAELAVTCEKILRRDIFGLDKYLAGFGVERFERVVAHADERDEVVDKLVAALRALGAGRRLVESVSLVGDELLTNAVYNAPRDGAGQPRYAHVNRRHKIALEPNEHVRLEYGSDGRLFALAVTDRFGALAPESLRGGIERCLTRHDPFEHKPGGAGIGLYASLCHADQLVLNLEPGVRTEVIALWHLARKSGGRGAGVASLHVFQQGDVINWPRARDTSRVAASDPSVALSDSIKGDIFGTLIDGDGASVTMTPPRPPAESPDMLPVGDPMVMEAGALDGELDEAAAAIVTPLSPEESQSLEEADDVEAHDPTAHVEELRLSGESELATEAPEAEVDELRALDMDEDELSAWTLGPGSDAADTAPLPVIEELLGGGQGVASPAQNLPAEELEGLSAETRQRRPVAPAEWNAFDPDEPEPSAPGGPLDLADLYEMGSLMDATALGSSPESPSAAGPAWIGALTCLRGVQIAPREQSLGIAATAARVRESPTLADAVEVLLSLLAGHWSAAMLLCRVGDTLVPWTAAGAVESWEELCDMELPLAQGWLSARSLSPGVTLARLDEDPTARRLSDSLSGQDADQGLALSFVLDRSVLIVFACRLAGDAAQETLSDYEELQRELSELTARVDRFSRQPTMRQPSARVRAG